MILSSTRGQAEMPYRQYLRKNLWVTGWGMILAIRSPSEDVSITPYLQKLNCRQLTEDRCKRVYSSFGDLHETQACARATTGFWSFITPVKLQ